MHQIIGQYLLTCYDDGTFKITERKMPERTENGRFTGKRRALGQTTCPACGARLNIFAKEIG